MFSRKQYQRFLQLLSQEFANFYRKNEPFFTAVKKFANSESGRLFLKALEVERKIKHRGK